MVSSVTPQQKNQHDESASENEPLRDSRVARFPEEIEVLIARLNHRLDERMRNSRDTTDSMKTLRRMRHARTFLQQPSPVHMIEDFLLP